MLISCRISAGSAFTMFATFSASSGGAEKSMFSSVISLKGRPSTLIWNLLRIVAAAPAPMSACMAVRSAFSAPFAPAPAKGIGRPDREIPFPLPPGPHVLDLDERGALVYDGLHVAPGVRVHREPLPESDPGSRERAAQARLPAEDLQVELGLGLGAAVRNGDADPVALVARSLRRHAERERRRGSALGSQLDLRLGDGPPAMRIT